MRARIENGVVVEFLSPVGDHPIEDCFHPSILAQCVPYVEGMVIGEPVPEVVVEVAEASPEPTPEPTPEPPEEPASE